MDEDFTKSPLAPLFQRGVFKNWHDVSTHKFVAHPLVSLFPILDFAVWPPAKEGVAGNLTL